MGWKLKSNNVVIVEKIGNDDFASTLLCAKIGSSRVKKILKNVIFINNYLFFVTIIPYAERMYMYIFLFLQIWNRNCDM